MGSEITFNRRASRSYERRATRLLGGFYRAVAAEVAAAAGPGAVVLDVGTGPGRLPRALAGLRPDLSLHGADLSPHMVELARRAGPGIAFEVADVAALPWPDASLDLIVSTLSAHEWPSPPAAAAELTRGLRPGGRLLIYDFRFARLGALTAALSRRAQVRRSALHPLSIYTRLETTQTPQTASRTPDTLSNPGTPA
jgi:ubiquinone/menaquinone biosynthesis C-methylase UbiE